MENHSHQKLIEVINQAAIPMPDYSSLLDQIGDARFVLMGEATHGTHEFYQARIEITQQLILQKGFMAVAIEGDWPDVYRVNRYVQGKWHQDDAEKSLDNFQRFPHWMWRNTTIVPFLRWLRKHNDAKPDFPVGFYGLDLYSLNTSMQAVIDYLSKVDPSAAQDAKLRYACSDHFNLDPQMYGYLSTSGMKKTCIDEVINELCELQHRSTQYLRQDGIVAE